MHLKRLMRSRSIFYCLIIIFFVYVSLNQFFLNLIGLQAEKPSYTVKRNRLNELPRQIVSKF